jgi:hypothetical protein
MSVEVDIEAPPACHEKQGVAALARATGRRRVSRVVIHARAARITRRSHGVRRSRGRSGVGTADARAA